MDQHKKVFLKWACRCVHVRQQWTVNGDLWKRDGQTTWKVHAIWLSVKTYFVLSKI